MSTRAPLNSLWQRVRRVICCIAVTILASCGGGTSGTGLQTFDGQVKSTDGDPIVGASVTLTATGEGAVTDERGRFVLSSAVELEPQQNLEFRLESPEFAGTFVVPDGAVVDGSSQITLDIVVDPVSRTLELTNFSLQVQMVGPCAAAFLNEETVRQVVDLPRGTDCTVEVEVRGDGLLRGDIPVALQVRTCSGKPGVWQTLRVAATGEGTSLGKVEMDFPFSNTEKYCRYRIVAPYQNPEYRAAAFAIESLQEQAAKREIDLQSSAPAASSSSRDTPAVP